MLIYNQDEGRKTQTNRKGIKNMKIYVAKIFEYLPDGSYYPSEYEKYFVFKEAAEEYVAKAIAKGAEKNSRVEEIEVEE